MTKKWFLISGLYLIGLFLMVYALMAMEGTPQIVVAVVAAIFFIISLRMRFRYRAKK